MLGGKARALTSGRYHVGFEDIRALAHPVLRHRVLTNFHAESEGITSDSIVDQLLEARAHAEVGHVGRSMDSRSAIAWNRSRFRRSIRRSQGPRADRQSRTAGATVVNGFINGLHRAPYLGASMDFAEHRGYVPGDDIRRMDWKLFARTDRYF